MDLYQYYTENELELFELEQEMKFMPSQQNQYDYVLGTLFATLIKKQVRVRYPRTWRSVSTLAINALATQIAECSGYYQISLMPYEAMMQAWREQSYRLICVGKRGKREYFALIDEQARQIGVHIPKSHRQLKYEKLISDAIDDFNTYLKKGPKKIEPNPEIQSIVTEELWRQKLDDYEAVKVRPTKKELCGTVVAMKNHRKIQMYFDERKATLYYHLA